MTVYKHRIDRRGSAARFTAHFESEGGSGPMGSHGLGRASGMDIGVYDLDGELRGPDGVGDYVEAAAVPGQHDTPPRMTLTVQQDGEVVLTRTFLPVETAAGVLDINAALLAGRAQVAQPDQLRALGTMLDEGEVLHAETRQALADTAQSAAEALATTGINPAHISETTADPPAAPDGTRGAKRTAEGGLVRLERVSGAWVERGQGLPGRSEVLDKQPALAGLTDYRRLPSIPNGPLGVPERDPDLMHYTDRGLKIHRDPYGLRENATVVSIIASDLPDPETRILGLNSPADAASYPARDTAALYVGIEGRAANLSTAAQTTYTTTGAKAPGVDYSRLRVGMWVDTTHSPKWGGLLTGWDAQAQTLTVTQWTSTGTGQAGVPANGMAVSVNPQTAMWGQNVTAWLRPDSMATVAYGQEITTFNFKRGYDPAEDEKTRVHMYGGGTYNKGERGFIGWDVGGDNYHGMRVLGGHKSGYAVQHQPGAEGIPAQSPQVGFEDESRSPIAFGASGQHTYGFAATGKTTEAAFLAQPTTGAFGYSGQGAGITTATYHSKRNGLAALYQDAAGRQAFRLNVTAAETRLGLGNNVDLFAAPGEAGVLHCNALATIFDGNVRGTAFWANGKQVVGEQQAAIPDSDGSAADNKRAINAILAVMRAHGLIES
ncbi:hypothetical protein Dcar01_03523 [Deinococcus carri]|uniref:Uncharacterized protein n=1 Tax=Deinococcus carri TaxID=1211323 RepID=A0ABP9WEV2_9DEIO